MSFWHFQHNGFWLKAVFINPAVASKYKLANDLSNRADELMERVWQCAVSFGRRIVCSKIDSDVLDCLVQTCSQSFTYVSERTIDYKRKCFDMLCLWLYNSLQVLAFRSIDPLTLFWIWVQCNFYAWQLNFLQRNWHCALKIIGFEKCTISAINFSHCSHAWLYSSVLHNFLSRVEIENRSGIGREHFRPDYQPLLFWSTAKNVTYK